ncbi:MAG TPA: DUF21 domain-containing protein [Candidatus Latescibacteria bacterium]|nr:DUF21 domain-containing protein [Candidatus Latescibacterota bacterium]
MSSLIWVIGACILLSGFFSGAEAGLVSCNRVRIRHLAGTRNWRARLADRLLEDPERFLVLVLVGTNVANITATTLTTYLLVRLMGEGRAEWMTTALLLPTIILFGEVLPKAAFRHWADILVVWTAPLLWGFLYLFRPVIWVTVKPTKFLLRTVFRVSPEEHSRLISREELRVLIEEGRRSGSVDQEKGRMLAELFKVRGIPVRDVMIPIGQLATADVGTPVEEAVRLPLKAGSPGIVAFRKGRAVGMVFLDRLLEAPKEAELRDLVEGVEWVQEHERAYKVLDRLRRSNHHVALVEGSIGGCIGVVRLEDVVEEIVGEIWEEV